MSNLTHTRTVHRGPTHLTYCNSTATMPPIRTEKTKKAIEREGRVEAAISAYKNQQFSSNREAGRVYNMSYTIFLSRINGRATRVNLRANSHKLTENEEETLVRRILDLNKRGLSPWPAFIENMANHLLSQHQS